MIDPQPYWAIVRLAARLVPPARRAEWLAEWNSEFWHALRSRPVSRLEALRFTLGAFHDALWVRHDCGGFSPALALQSPQACLALLSAVAAIFVSSSLYAGGGTLMVAPELGSARGVMLWILLQACCALLILPAVTTINLGRTFATSQSPARRLRLRRYAFTTAKAALIVVIAVFGAIVTPPPLRPNVTLIACILGFRWVLLDHRARCPVCLRRLVRPVRIGSPSHTFLAPYGTELSCDRGHGVMCAPETMSNYTAERWSDSV